VKDQVGPIDVLFLDADKPGYVDYLEKLLPKIRPGGLVIAHNARTPAPDPRFMKAITQDPNLETAFLLMEGSGVSVTLKKR
jgi:predicted O-methyltransferase YrrM